MTRWFLPLAAVALALPAPALAQSDDPAGWAGFYVGVDLGLASGKLRTSGADSVQQLTNINPPGPQPITVVPGYTQNFSGSDRRSGLLYGATAGFMLRSGNWLFGLEGDGHGPRDAGSFSASFAKFQTVLEPAGTLTIVRDARISWDWSVRGRVGYTWGPSMVYAAGGVASARIRLRGDENLLVPAGNGSPSGGNPPFANPGYGPISETVTYRGTQTGWTAGLGGEHRMSRHISLGLDARYSDYGNRNYDLTGCAVGSSGLCRNVTLSGQSTITFPAGTTPATITRGTQDPYPGTSENGTRVSLNEWRLSARLIFRF